MHLFQISVYNYTGLTKVYNTKKFNYLMQENLQINLLWNYCNAI